MRRRNLALSIVFCLILVFISFFSALSSEKVVADNGTPVFYYQVMNSNNRGVRIFTTSSEKNYLNIKRDLSNTLTFYKNGSVYENSNIYLNDLLNDYGFYFFSYNNSSNSDPNELVDLEPIESLFDDIEENSMDVGENLTIDLTSAFDYGFDRNILLGVNEQSPENPFHFSIVNESLTITDIDWKLGNNYINFKYEKYGFDYTFCAEKHPEITDVKLGDTLVDNELVDITTGTYDLSFKISPSKGLDKVEVSINDVTTDNSCIYSITTNSKSSDQTATIDLTGDNVYVDHTLSYVITITDENNHKYVYRDGSLVDSDEDVISGSFKVVPTHDLSVSLGSDNSNGKEVAKNGDKFTICLSSSETITEIDSTIEGIKDNYIVPDEEEDEPDSAWGLGDDGKYIYSGTIESADSLRYLDAKFSVTFSDGTDHYDDYSYDAKITIYPPLDISVKKYNSSSIINKDESFTVTLNNKSTTTIDVTPTLSIVSFSKTNNSDEKPITNFTSSISGLTATIVMADISDFCTDNSTFSFYMTIQDNAGNTYAVPINPGCTYYGEFEVSSPIVLSTSNPNTYTDEEDIVYGFVNDNDSLNLKFKSNHDPVNYVIKFEGNDYFIKDVATKDYTTGLYSIEINDISNCGFIPGEEVNFAIIFSDEYDVLEGKMDFNHIIYLNSFGVAYNNDDFASDSYLTSEDEIDLAICSSDLESTNREVRIKKISLEYTNLLSNQFHSIDCWEEEDGTFGSVKSKSIPMSLLADINPLIDSDYLKLKVKVELEDRSGNISEETIDPNCYYYRSIDESISKVDITNSYDSSVAKVGDTLTLKFKSTHPLATEKDMDQSGNRILKGTLNGDAVTFSSSDGLNWTAEFTVSKDNKWDDNSGIDLSLELYDESDNEHYTMTNEDVNNSMVYYSPISISNFVFKSDNKDSDGKLANDSDKMMLSFDSTHQLKVENAYIANVKVDLKETVSNGVYSYATTCKVSDLEIEDNNPVTFGFDLNDQAGNKTYSLNYDSTKINVIYQAPIELSETSIISNNANDEKLAKDGNYITVKFDTTHPVNIVSATVAGNDLTLKSLNNDKMHWSGTYLVTNNIVSDNDKISVKVEVGDDSGNTSAILSSDDIMYYAPLSVSSATISTDNSNDSTKYAIDGNTVVVSFITNHKIDSSSSSFSLAGHSGLSVTEEALNNGSYKYSFSRKITNGELTDLSVVAFSLSVTDIAGNSTVSLDEKSSSVINSITYYSPLTITTSIESNGSNSNYAKNGDTVTVKATVNHAAQATSASLLDRSMSVSGNDSTSITLTYTISGAESSMTEGSLSTSCSFADVAGNTLSVTEINTGSVIYDRTKPSIDVTNGFSGFSASDITFDISISDSNIDKDKTSVNVNGSVLKIGDGLDTNGTTYSTVVKNEDNGTLTVTISAVDLAGNSATPVKYTVTIDKTNPQLTTTTLYSTSGKIFKPGLVVADLFEIEEDNMSEITCTVSDGSSVYDWDINTPIETDGKKTISVIAVDKAGNASEQLVFDLYIDGTAPNPILTDKAANKVLNVGSNDFSSPTTVVFSLQNLSYNPDEPDKFTKIEITCPDGSVVDIMADNSVNSDGDYFFDFNDPGSYTVVIEAEDELGNATGEIKYEVNIKEKPIEAIKRIFSDEDGKGGTKFNVKKAAIIGGGSVAALAIITTTAVFLIRRKRIR